MSKIAIFYFSGTGNTEFVCKCYKKYFEEKSLPTEMFPIETIQELPDLTQYEYIGIGFPIYAFSYSPNMDAFFEKIPSAQKGQKCFIIATCNGGYFNAVGQASEKMKEKGYEIRRSRAFVMPSNFTVLPFNSKPSKSSIEEKANKSEERAKQTIEEILEGKTKVDTQFWVIGAVLSVIISFFFRKFGTVNMSKKYFVGENCISCGLCAKTCPMENIEMVNGKPAFGRNCIVCCRCYTPMTIKCHENILSVLHG
ncbi:MAG: EFR1 family ferrodoxin, partial [Candidatus Eremiobacteraeota bacterium]|nr:EFR1 family ferrodoxin [Candidatus Eremiobacteraeota bacterium]